MNVMRCGLVVLVGLGLLLGCGSESRFDGDGGAGDDGGGDGAGDGDGCQALDILFVVDNSGSMVEEQENLAANLPLFVDVLDAYVAPDGGELAYRIGVITPGVNRHFTQKILGMNVPMTSTGPDGALQGQAECGLGEHPWVDGPGGDLSGKFACMATQGTAGSGNEMPFAAIELALGAKSEPGGPNEGFYRRNEGSLLVVVILTDEDDCSIEEGGTMVVSVQGGSDCSETQSTGLYQVPDVQAWIDGVVGGPGRAVVVGIGGAEAGGCSSSFGEAIYAKRLQKMTDAYGEHGFFGDICVGDLWVALEAALGIIETGCASMPPME